MYCYKCGREISDEAEVCVFCGAQIKNQTPTQSSNLGTENAVRFLLTIFLGLIGSFIINHTTLKPNGWTSRTLEYFILSFLTFGIYPVVAAFCNLVFDPNKQSNIGYKKDETY